MKQLAHQIPYLAACWLIMQSMPSVPRATSIAGCYKHFWLTGYQISVATCPLSVCLSLERELVPQFRHCLVNGFDHHLDGGAVPL